MRTLTAAIVTVAALAGASGCSPYNVDMSLEGPNWYVTHPTCECLYCPYATPRCPYYYYPGCEWGFVPPQPEISARNSPPIVPKPDQISF